MANMWTESSNTVKAIVAIIGVGFTAGIAWQALAGDVKQLKELAKEERLLNESQTAQSAEQSKVLDRLIILHQMQSNQPIIIRPGVAVHPILVCQVNSDCAEATPWCDTTVNRCKEF